MKSIIKNVGLGVIIALTLGAGAYVKSNHHHSSRERKVTEVFKECNSECKDNITLEEALIITKNIERSKETNSHHYQMKYGKEDNKRMNRKHYGSEHNNMMQQNNQMLRENKHEPGYVITQKGDYTIGRIETPKETIIYRFKSKELETNNEKKQLIKKTTDLINKYSLKKYEELRPDFQNREKGRIEYRISLEEFKKSMRNLDDDLENKMSKLDRFESFEINHQQMADHFKEYGKNIENRSKEWENYAKDNKDFKNHPDMNKWRKDMNKWGKEDIGKWQDNIREYMQKNIEKKTFGEGEFYIRINKNDSLIKKFPMPPEFPRPPMNYDKGHDKK